MHGDLATLQKSNKRQRPFFVQLGNFDPVLTAGKLNRVDGALHLRIPIEVSLFLFLVRQGSRFEGTRFNH
jgi:hypothetical protein